MGTLQATLADKTKKMKMFKVKEAQFKKANAAFAQAETDKANAIANARAAAKTKLNNDLAAAKTAYTAMQTEFLTQKQAFQRAEASGDKAAAATAMKAFKE